MKTRRKRTLKKKGGVILFQQTPQDILPELIRFSNGETNIVKNGGDGIILQLNAENSSVLKNKTPINSILVKIVGLDQPLTMGNTSIRATTLDEFQEEVDIHKQVCERSFTRFDCSIAPSILYVEVYTPAELNTIFPTLGKDIITKGRIGIIFMENITRTENPRQIAKTMGDVYAETYDIKLFSKARRLLIMLAQLGFLHNDYHVDNFVVSGESLLIIDFGRATRIPRNALDQYVTPDKITNIVAIIQFLSVNTDHVENPRYILNLQWLRQNQIDIYIRAIDPTISISTEKEVVDPLRLTPQEKKLVVLSTHEDFETRNRKRLMAAKKKREEQEEEEYEKEETARMMKTPGCSIQ